MGTVPEFNTKNLMNRVYCVDMINFNGNEDPLLYRRHFTAVHAFDVSGFVQSTIESESNSMSIRSYQEIMMHPDVMISGTAGIDPASATNWFVQWTNLNGVNSAKLWNRNPEGQDNRIFDNTNSGDIDIIGKVTQAHLPNQIVDNYEMLGYFNHTYALPFRRHHWKINAPKI